MRTAAAVILGYLALAIFVMVALSLAWMVVGPEHAFKAGSTEVSTTWIALDYILGFVAAVLGGWLAVLVARKRKASIILAALVVVLGLIMAPMQKQPEQSLSPEEVTELGFMEAGQHAQHPPWYFFTIPFVGCVGVLLGGRLRTTAEP